MSDQHQYQPQFQSNIPAHLLTGETEAMKYLITELSKNTQATEFLLTQRKESGIILDEIKGQLGKIHEQCLKTNGTVLKHTAQIAVINENKEDVDEIVSVKRFVQRYMLNRYVVGLAFFLLIGAVKVFSSDELRGYFFKIVGLG